MEDKYCARGGWESLIFQLFNLNFSELLINLYTQYKKKNKKSKKYLTLAGAVKLKQPEPAKQKLDLILVLVAFISRC